MPTAHRDEPEAAVPGDIVHVDGRVLGRHKGIIHYTVGQRRGLGLGLGLGFGLGLLSGLVCRLLRALVSDQGQHQCRRFLHFRRRFGLDPADALDVDAVDLTAQYAFGAGGGRFWGTGCWTCAFF